MILDRFEPLAVFDIWSPRYHDKTVLLSMGKVKATKCKYIKVKFTKANSMEGDWVVPTATVKKCRVESNGTIQCYVVPLDKLEVLEINQRSVYAD